MKAGVMKTIDRANAIATALAITAPSTASTSVDCSTEKSETPIRPLWQNSPKLGQPAEIANGLWLLPLPLSAELDHINVYVLEDKTGWTLVDTGSHVPECQAALEKAFSQPPFSHRPITRVITTHFHPDHIGLAGQVCKQGASLVTSRTCWMQTRLLTIDQHPVPQDHEISFVRNAGMKGMMLEAFRRRASSNYAQLVLPIPAAYQRICEGDTLKIGDRTWTIRMGDGHAAEHVTLWSEDGYVITGDQVLPGISSNLSVHPSEPNADVVSEWIDSCWRFSQLASSNMLCLPAHNIPFYGISTRCQQLIDSHLTVLDRLLQSLNQPRTAIDCLEIIYRRPLKPYERGLLIAETVGYLNHLYHQGLITRELSLEEAYIWQRA